MTLAPIQPLTMARSHAMVDGAKQDALAAPNPVEGAEAADRPAVVALEDQRERAQQEFKRIWNLCTLMQ
ncbi:hypothetical protein [Methylobacterium sp. SyP6R]|uniref:hypothetical protein n=1 Tax=Methylobacterium sp. SyP6R TaxID=2718876 RepID=UPI001F198308|nr:hypothetical protein [Methylobacterium sp. SyP6R]MCF4127414.1 hypothetical protein [Methylobacterium sp. SyP6R]